MVRCLSWKGCRPSGQEIPYFIQFKCSLPSSQKRTFRSYHESAASSPHPHALLSYEPIHVARFATLHGGKCSSWFAGLLRRVVWWLNREDGGSMVLRNVGIQLSHCTAQQPRKSRSAFSCYFTIFP